MSGRLFLMLQCGVLATCLCPVASLGVSPGANEEPPSRNNRCDIPSAWMYDGRSELHPGSAKALTDPEEEIPEWLSKLIEREKAGPPANPPARVVRYTYRGQVVYYIPPRCCDVPSRLYDRDGKLICSPDGGRTGGGDHQCADFFKTRKDEKLIWKDTRSRRK